MCYIRGGQVIRVRHGSYGKYSGPYIKGTEPAMDVPTMESAHWHRAFWQTIMVESGGNIGSIMMADGTGMTAGLHQSILVYPRNLKVQGPLVKMLWLMDHVLPVPYYIGDLFEEQDWYLAPDKRIRYRTSGKEVPPRVLRDTLTPLGGKVPRRGARWEQSKRWAEAFHDLFTARPGRKFQIQHGIDEMTKFARSHLDKKRLGNASIEDAIYRGNAMGPEPFANPVNDLAMAMWWNYKTNAPAPAKTRLGRAIKRFQLETDSPTVDFSDADDDRFGRFLINQLRSSTYGRWATNRYDRTRQHSMKVWPRQLFTGPKAVMPKRV
jgi:hypothetical protein